jgi:hypothetical protein
MTIPLNVYIGFDSSNYGQQLSADICKRSIEQQFNNTLYDLSVHFLIKKKLEEQGYFDRAHDTSGSTEFTYTRFLVPFLNNYQGYAVFCDSDFLWNCDVSELIQYINTELAVSCVQHEHLPNTNIKMDGKPQTPYPRKNWSSLMVFNCSHPSVRNLTCHAVNTQTPIWLHRMLWAKDTEIGQIPITYNYLVGTYPYIQDVKAIHYTDGGPWYYLCKHLNNKYPVYRDMWLQMLNTQEKIKFELDIKRQQQDAIKLNKTPYLI